MSGVIRLRALEVPGLHRPGARDLAPAALCVALMALEAALRHLTPTALEGVLVVVAALPAVLRWQVPVVSLALSFVTLLGLIQTDFDIYTTIPGPAVLCAYAVADRHGRRAAVVAGAAALPLVLAILQIYSPHELFSVGTAQNLALVVLPLALGVAAHDRRAYTGVLIERARTAERNQEETARRRVSEERLRIARDVHDVVAHAMVTINVQAGVGAYLVHSDPDEAHATLRAIKQVSGDALGDLRSTLGILRAEGTIMRDDETPGPPVQGVAALDELFENLPAGVELTVEVDPAARSLPTSVDTTAYRIVQEALTNVLRHAGPTRARILVAREQGRLLIDVLDEGGSPTGNLRDTGSGKGLRGMRERAAAVGGALEAGPRPEGGWRVTASLPLEPTA